MTPGNPRVLLISRDGFLCRELCQRLEHLGLRPEVASHLSGDVEGLTDDHPPVVMVDVRWAGLGIGEGVALLRASSSRARSLYLTAGDGAAERVALLRAGAEDVMTHPIDMDELCLRITKLTDRPPGPPGRLVVGELALDEQAREVTVGRRRCRLSPTEFAVLRLLMGNCGVVVSKQRLLRDVWGYEAGDGHIVELYVSYLRTKLGLDARHLIHTVRGAGYMVRPAAPQVEADRPPYSRDSA
jgi:two-component system OmpR family response regulator